MHLEIITERLNREFNLDVITTMPSVTYKVYKRNGDMEEISNPISMPDADQIDYTEEPFIKAEIFAPSEYVGAIMDLGIAKRGEYKNLQYLYDNRVRIDFELPLAEVVFDFFDKLKSATHGYASLDYEISEYKRSDMVKVDMLLNGEPCDALSMICHRTRAYERSRAINRKA